MKIEAEMGYLTIQGPIPLEFLKVIGKLSGRKSWRQSKSVKVEGSPYNIDLIKRSGFEIEWDDKTNDLKEIEEIQKIIATAEDIKHNYHPKYALKAHQQEALQISCHKRVFAYFLEMGLGKTALTIANFCILFLEGKLKGVLIIAPKGVHKQWIAEEIPKHIDPNIPLNLTLWTSGKYYASDELKINGSLNIFSINVDAIRTEAGEFAIYQFLNLFDNKAMIIIDESHKIGNYGAKRTKYTIELRQKSYYRRILTGTPIATNLVNIWTQFNFLDPRIIGIYYITAFKSRYCEVGGWSGNEIIAVRNVEEFYTLIAPHCYRKTKKECLDLPDKIYEKVPYELGKEARHHYENIKHAFMTELTSGKIVDAKNALAALVRLQQICSGFLPDDLESKSKWNYEFFTYERAEVALDIVHQVEGPVIIWARFIPDIIALKHVFEKEFKNDIVTLSSIELFKTGQKRIALLNPSSGGEGQNLQDSGCQTMIYLNNSFNLIHRIQSEDRVHRMGMRGALTIFDIVAEKTIDHKVLENLKDKKDLALFVLDEIRQLVE